MLLVLSHLAHFPEILTVVTTQAGVPLLRTTSSYTSGLTDYVGLLVANAFYLLNKIAVFRWYPERLRR